MSTLTPQQWRSKALAAFQTGDAASALALIKDGLAAHPNDAPFWDFAGDISLKTGDATGAATRFQKAAELAPESVNFAIHHGIALSAAEQHHKALAVYQGIEAAAQHLPVYCSSRGTAARGARRPAEAQEWYDRALALEPNRTKALHGRARVALERGDEAALQWFDKALAVNQGDADLWLGKAQALDVLGRNEEARQIAEALAKQAPAWAEGLRFLAQLRLQAGEADFSSHYADAAAGVPQDPNIYVAWCSVLASLDYNEKAAEVARAARQAFPSEEHFQFLEAVNASEAGQTDHAEPIFNALKKQDDDRWLQEARHRIRRAEFERAAALIDRTIDHDPWNISAWALRGIVWRAVGDARSQWLQEQAELVQLVPLRDAETILPKVIPFLHNLHARSPFPLGQSLRGGTQTRGNLFDRGEPVLAELKTAIMGTVDDYRQSLPPHDPDHPLLRTLDSEWDMAGSWSVRLSGGGDFHTSHIHPQGILSSALYLELPENRGGDPMAGWLEIGRPAPGLRSDLEPLRIIEPKVGHLALFPSTLYHGTRPFDGDQRMTVAFDINLRQGTDL